VELLAELSRNGLLGLLLALSIGGNVYQYKRGFDLQERRVTDAQQNRDAVIEPLKTMQRTLDAIMGILVNAGKK